MEFICNDLDGKTPWHYNADEKVYYRDFKDHRHQGKIRGQDIPNPDLLLKNRTDFLDKAAKGGARVSEDDRKKAIPSATTYALWKHWQGVDKP